MVSNRNRVVSALVKRVTPAQPLQSHPYAAYYPVLCNGFTHVLRASWVISAGRRQERRNKELVPSQEDDQDCLHRANIRPTSRHKSSNGASKTERRGLKTTDQFAGRPSNCERTACRIRRLIRLRCTAFPTARGTVKPKREGTGSPVVCKQKQAK